MSKGKGRSKNRGKKIRNRLAHLNKRRESYGLTSVSSLTEHEKSGGFQGRNKGTIN